MQEKSVLISIQPKWCELILRGKKTVEVRKSRPKLKPPFKVYIYATKPKSKNDLGLILDKGMFGNLKKVRFFHKCNYAAAKYLNMQILSGKVIGEFTCNLIAPIAYTTDGLADVVDCRTACMKPMEFLAYGKGDVLYGWHISDLVIYDKPKELNEFCKIIGSSEYEPLTRPPQSWCYVHKLDDI